ncbi:MAG TPA: MBL fold metallo-hydrolase [Steroidobacteraceae bacterium]|jgi:beta-lactamase superfamily II metal-dependent hydrolase|nr:MBL fold metallo-hydrolase [Steroidobacteraceae bacterium]
MSTPTTPVPAPSRPRAARLALPGALALAAVGLFAGPGSAYAAAKTLQIYFIDVEGGQSTLIVTPDHRSLLIDTGWAGDGVGYRPGDPHRARDANRIVAAAHDAGIEQIDYLLITHFHDDHDGGVAELARLMPIRTFVDHGAPSPGAVSSSVDTKNAFEAYEAVRKDGKHLEPRPGDRLPLRDAEAIVVTSAGETLDMPLPRAGLTNDACKVPAIPPGDPFENPRSTGIVLRFDRFRFLDLGDLSGPPLHDLACPKDLIGPVDVYLVAHHGGPDIADPATFAAFKPRVAVMNNGLKKGGSRATYQLLHEVAGLEDVWQLHASGDAGDANFAADHIANLDETTDHWIKLVAHADGSFEVINPRTGSSKSYAKHAGQSSAPMPVG